MAETLREFLVELGWNVEKTKHDQIHFEAAMESAIIRANLLGEVLIKIAEKVVAVVKEASTHFNDLYSKAQRMNTSAALANDFPVLIRKYGGNPTEAAAWLETAARKLRDNHNNIAVLNQLGFGENAETGKLEIQKEMLENLRKLPVQYVESLTELLGLDDQPILLMKKHIDQILPDLKAMENYRNQLGFDLPKATERGHTFALIWISVAAKLDNIAKMINAGLTLAFTPLITELNAFLTINAKAIGAAIKIVVDALVAMLKSWAADFDVILKDPKNLEAFNKSTKELAESLAILAKKMSNLIYWVKAALNVGDALNYLSSNKSDPASYERGRQLFDKTGNPYGDASRAINPTEADVIKGINEERAKPEWDWRGAPGRWLDRVREGWGYSKSNETPASKSATIPTPAAPAQPPIVFGDSIGVGAAGAANADASEASEGKGPAWVAERIANYKKSLRDRDVWISSGSSNAPRDAAWISRQIQFAISKGADPKHIKVMGVGSLKSALGYYPGVSEEVNATLKRAAESAGASFQDLPAGTDVHPNYDELANSLRSTPVAPPVASPVAPVKRSPYGDLAPFALPPAAAERLTISTLGGSKGDTHINAPSQTTIHVDGTGDPTAVAHLVHKAQKGVNADLSQTLQGATP